MGILVKLSKFSLGSALGAAVGVAVGTVLAPQRGEELQSRAAALLDEARSTGRQAQSATETAMRERFRVQTNDPQAFTITPDGSDR